jgi:hypothetical protein
MAYQKRHNHGGFVMRSTLVLIGLVLLTAGARAEPTRDEVMSGAARCAGIADNRIWLDCFYGSAQPMRTLLGLPSAPPAQIKLVPPPGAAYIAPNASNAPVGPPAEKSRGFFGDLLGPTGPIDHNMPMASYKFGRNGGFTVVLKNGETYRQEESDTAIAHWNKPASSYLETIIGSGDGFILKVRDEPGAVFRVRRV